jgi:MinD superfamily P-loop ATPase
VDPSPEPRILRCRDPQRERRLVTLRLGPPRAIAASRCNRCGACLRLDCGAIFDEGAESLVVDPGACSGCGNCGAVCRSRAIGPMERFAGTAR